MLMSKTHVHMENHYWRQETARTTTSPERQTRTAACSGTVEHCKEAPSILTKIGEYSFLLVLTLVAMVMENWRLI